MLELMVLGKPIVATKHEGFFLPQKQQEIIQIYRNFGFGDDFPILFSSKLTPETKQRKSYQFRGGQRRQHRGKKEQIQEDLAKVCIQKLQERNYPMQIQIDDFLPIQIKDSNCVPLLPGLVSREPKYVILREENAVQSMAV